ncbi:MAG: hypothetical protein Fur005_32640 [Roseiflexaceae bacterium]
MTTHDDPPPSRPELLRLRVRQLILMRETGPKRPAWHRERMRLIWRLHDQIRAAEQGDPGDQLLQPTKNESVQE